MFNLQQWHKRVETWFVGFILAQVPIDLLTTFVLKVVGSTITPGLLVRSLMILIMAMYLFVFQSNKVRLFVIAACIVVGFQLYQGVVAMNGGVVENLNYHFRTMYYIFTFLSYYHLLKHTNRSQVLTYLNVNAFMIGAVFLIASITRIYTLSYPGEERVGHQAWFASGNEISVILAIILFVSAYNWLHKPSCFTASTILLTIFANLSIGTKANLLAIILLVISTMILFIVQVRIVQRRKLYGLLFIVYLIISVLPLIQSKLVPPIHNSIVQLELQKMINNKLGWKDGDAVDPTFAEERYSSEGPKPSGEVLSSATFSLTDQGIYVSGFHYVYGTDIRHPNYTEKVLKIRNLITRKTFEVPLKDEYNRNIITKDKNDSSFAGFSGLFDFSKLELNGEYRFLLVQKVDGRTFTTILDDSNTFFSFPLNDLLTISGKKVDVISKTYDPLEIKSMPDSATGYLFLLSNRDKRVKDFVKYLNQTKPEFMLIGTSYIGNYERLVGFSHLELDFIELFFTYGIIGFFVLIAPYGYLIIRVSYGTLRHIRRVIQSPQFLMFASACVLSIVIGLFAGTSISRPSVVIYIAILFALYNHNLYTWSVQDEKNNS